MKQYEDLSKEAKQGLDDYQKALPKLFEKSDPDVENYPKIRHRTHAVFSAKGVKIFTYARNVVITFCMVAGATVEESYEAATYAASKKYWFNFVKDEKLKKFWTDWPFTFDF